MIIKFENISSLSHEKTICVPGCFDLFHIGHVNLFKKIKKEFPNFKLVVTVSSDETIKRKKGKLRPIISGKDRVDMINSCKYVDYVYSSPTFEDNFENRQILRIKDLRPDYLVYENLNNIEEINKIEELGTQIIELKSENTTHTSEIIEKIKNE